MIYTMGDLHIRITNPGAENDALVYQLVFAPATERDPSEEITMKGEPRLRKFLAGDAAIKPPDLERCFADMQAEGAASIRGVRLEQGVVVRTWPVVARRLWS